MITHEVFQDIKKTFMENIPQETLRRVRVEITNRLYYLFNNK